MQRKLVSVVGARPQFVKLAPLCRVFESTAYERSVEHIIVHTGQHYDAGMSDVFFDELKIPRADVDLGVGSASHGVQTARMLEKLEATLIELAPDLVVVYGDTNSTLAGALAAAKLHIPVAHMEAGLRSFNRAMPEEINRIVADHTANQLHAPTLTAMDNLAREGLAEKSVRTGDIMRDALLFNREIALQKSSVVQRLGLRGKRYGVVTIHRAENTDGHHLIELLRTLDHIAGSALPLIFPVHPRTARRLQTESSPTGGFSHLVMVEPLGYLDMLALLDGALLALTDSGGLQKEAFFMNCPCVTLRKETEWLETVRSEGNIVAGNDRVAIERAVEHWLSTFAHEPPDFSAAADEHFGRGDAALVSARVLCEFLDNG